MPTPGALTTLLTTAALAAALAGCGDSRDAGTTAPTDADVPVVRFAFGEGGLLPARARVDSAGGRVTLQLASRDGRPHGVTISAGGRRTRILVLPGRTEARTLTGLRPGRLRIVPDGAGEPAVLIVGRRRAD